MAELLPSRQLNAAFYAEARLVGARRRGDLLRLALLRHCRPPYAKWLDCERFADATRATIGDPRLRAFPLIGNVDQVCDTVDALNEGGGLHELRPLYDALR